LGVEGGEAQRGKLLGDRPKVDPQGGWREKRVPPEKKVVEGGATGEGTLGGDPTRKKNSLKSPQYNKVSRWGRKNKRQKNQARPGLPQTRRAGRTPCQHQEKRLNGREGGPWTGDQRLC